MILGFRSRRETRAVLDLQIDVVAKQNQIMEMPPPQQGLPTSQEQNFESLPLSHLKQALQAAGSFSSMEAEVETPPLVLLSSEPPNQKEVHEVINVDGDEESADTAIDVVEPSNIKKGKAVMNVPDGDLNGYSKSKKNQSGSQLKGSNANFSVGLEPPKFTMILGANKNMKSPLLSSNTTNFNSSSQLADASSHFGVKLHQSLLQAREKQTVSSSSYPSIPPSVSGSSAHPSLAKKIYFLNKFTSPPPTTPSSFIKLVSPSVYTLPDEDGDGQLPQNPSTDHPNETEDVLRRFEKFKHFDTVQDHSDHQYSKYDSAAVQPSNSLAKRIQEEWRILESDLPGYSVSFFHPLLSVLSAPARLQAYF
ncbi:hypothetical protein SAY86_006686 [Trapa natans]|uniref:Uncharacterized protein n=1 Tax=Trapa natans TaxID=22666 RepID=A0AAN7KZA7_TRANT|nr:hypothetical protein SAY86_006686 [Trapa natans]